jgi:pimeloyl-ACP methyl ester carboxylesterase
LTDRLIRRHWARVSAIEDDTAGECARDGDEASSPSLSRFDKGGGMKTFLIWLFGLFLLALCATGFLFWSATRGLDPAPLEARYVAPTDQFIDVDGLRVRVRAEGPTDAPALVLLHGFTFSLESFDGWAETLSKTRRVIRYDLAGHGLTGPDAQKRYAIAERVAFHDKVMNALGVAKADFAGNSLGGLIAWRYAAAHPERVGRLILIDAGGYSINGVGDAPVEAPAPMKAFLLTAPAAGVAAAFGAIYSDDTKITQQRLALARDMMRRRGNGRAAIEHIEEFTLPDPADDLAKIVSPTLILWGEADALIPLDHAQKFDGAIADSILITYPGVGHAPQEEIAAETLEDARGFLDAPTPSAPKTEPALEPVP